MPLQWTSEIPRSMHNRIRKRDKQTCKYCGRKTTSKGFHRGTVDHVIPLSKGGRTVDANLAWACYACNQAKGSLTGEEFRARLEARRNAARV